VLRLLKLCLLGLVLLLVAIASSLVAMRFGIHGREVRVPRLQGLTPTEAERMAGDQGLVLIVDSSFYSAEIPEGHIVSQVPPPGSKVRRGWKIRAARSLGSQRNSIPSVIGESQRVAEMNITRRGQQVGTEASIYYPGTQPSIVIAQTPPPDTKNAASPRVALLLSSPDNAQKYVMPGFIGHTLGSAIAAAEHEGFSVAAKNKAAPASAIVFRQSPAAGQKVIAGTVISFDAR
jgi:eukaryotic-like serine/threonine-protein kinase